jgi:hypothetical protein
MFYGAPSILIFVLQMETAYSVCSFDARAGRRLCRVPVYASVSGAVRGYCK